MVGSKYQVNRMGTKFLTNMWNIGGVDKASKFISRAQWFHMLAGLSDMCPSAPKDSTEAVFKDTKQVLIKDNRMRWIPISTQKKSLTA